MSTATSKELTPNAEAAEPNKPPNYKRLTDDDLFRHSSQYRFWSFTPEQLTQKRIQVNAQATSSVGESLRNFISENQANLAEEDIKSIEEKAVPVTMEEEIKLVSIYAKKLQGIAQHLNLPTEVVGTSITFFRRFYLENSVLQMHPKLIVLTTIFLACKSENYFIGIDSFSQKTKRPKDSILKYEFQLLESLRFSLLVHHPFKPLHGFFLDIQAVLHGKVDLKYMGQIYDKCKKTITEALLTDVVYFYTPPQITLAALLLEDEALTTRYLELKFHGNFQAASDSTNQESNEVISKSNLTINFDVLMNLITSCKQQIEKPTTVSVEEAIAIDAKVQFCSDPNKLLRKLKRRPTDSSLTQFPTDKRPKVSD
ncbi:hypothetical protein HG535_0E04190 [Zygotorulaspora mrakii]|uniref:Cyclin-like domain-containing protein n=1 Tax=Zygotorulaspora mrakii TaxID=42260 RepID=A0A7H9B3V3_ZYGMR|nr:uncharacterized protein HG535_0E04190 [Zygotorulaspora mrakii]QLG73335.1 hypothetical protein HG535_0E04190 [Zygotorulaspora mrakii]